MNVFYFSYIFPCRIRLSSRMIAKLMYDSHIHTFVFVHNAGFPPGKTDRHGIIFLPAWSAPARRR